MKRVALGLIAGLGFSGMALADGYSPGSIKDQPVAIWSWTGLYVGAQIGYQWNEADFQDPIPPFSGSYDADGVIGGGHIGYNWQHGNIVYGIEGDIEAADGSDIGPTQASDVFGRGEINWQASIRGRLGYSMNRTLIYVTGGVAWADFDFNYTCCGVGFIDPFSDTLTGWTVGGGGEFALGDKWTTRIEYRFTDFEEASGSIANCCAPAPFRQEHDVDSHAIRAALSYKF